ncbi:ZIP-like iron-zinc transporter [Gloeophyllum trabeum ATCC 11539]|uniref:ZIP-like iron-zinc transporter n=1 Tax=Gloeophyllum trabeum (strain ATCC 11539 / FP-39264 / Madison 617) TaxID=670483 RepID=S7PZA4_GLOTA|nr:ZIP-like iron-zinc transporter [Gloeophyllum trabeum ATCC 11539]EPQ52622.1 ZIP-like iron-zinc transporter [Gloeophyllum trabeum ATCC 11539]
MAAVKAHRIQKLCAAVLLFSAVSIAYAQRSQKEDLLIVRETEIRECQPVQQLNVLKARLAEGESPIMRQVFAWLFPFGPGWNSVLGTFYISSVPNFILAFIPAEINSNTLNTMTAFATGGLLSDVFLHLVPHSFMGEHQDESVHFVMVQEKRNILVGLGIFVGFASFFMMEKTLRVLGGDSDAPGHLHSHSHAPSPAEHAHTSGVEVTSTGSDIRMRGEKSSEVADTSDLTKLQQKEPAGSVSKLSAYLNLFGDFVHNITDGLAMAASFYSSPLIGATTTLACFAHEIPHEIADYSILIRSGFTKRQAMQSQFITAVGAFIGTFMGIAIHNMAASGSETNETTDLASALRQTASGILGTTVQAADLVIPFVAGGFLYIGAVAVLPTLLEDSKSGKQALREFGAMAFGVLCMFLVA